MDTPDRYFDNESDGPTFDLTSPRDSRGHALASPDFTIIAIFDNGAARDGNTGSLTRHGCIAEND